MSIPEYWELTPREFEKVIKVFEQRSQERAREQDAQNYLLGKYIAYAINDPKKYPKKPFLDKLKEKDERDEKLPMTDSEMERIMRANTIKLGGSIIKNES